VDAWPLALLALGATAIDVIAIGSSTLWQAVPLLVGTSVVAGAATAPWPKAARAAAGGLAALALWKGAQALRAQPYHPHHGYAWLRDNVAEDVQVGSWTAGAIGWFSHRHVVPLDGLVNEVSFVGVLRSGTLEQYLIDERIDVLTDILPPRDSEHPLLEVVRHEPNRYERVFAAPVRESAPAGDLFVVYRRVR
jgi:hypothetical protein